MESTTVCGAKTRAGGTCQKPSGPSSNRCNLHGGKTPRGFGSPHFRDGSRSKYMYLPPMLTARIEQNTGDVLDNLEQNIEIQKALETRLHEQFTDGVSLEKWRELKRELADFRKATRDYEIDFIDLQPNPIALIDKIDEIVVAGLQDAASEESLTAKIQSAHESQRKLTETVIKCRQTVQETYTQEQWNQFMNIVLNALRKTLEPKQMRVFINEIEVFQTVPKIEGSLQTRHVQ